MSITPVKLWRRQKETSALIGKVGKIVLYTIIRVPAKAFKEQAPYPVVIVEFEKTRTGSVHAERMILQLVDWEEKHLKIGQKVITVLRRHHTDDKEGIIPYNIKCKPIE
ncbi:MAG: OB-fold domain-containing protein [Patescibacteria group bacterium]|nr:OB-fold domain-containing protein [Patescibacteria group bacterium]